MRPVHPADPGPGHRRDGPAPTAPAATAPAPVPTVERELLLWRVRRGEQVSHFLGTCHLPLAVADVMPDPEPLAGSRRLLVELQDGDIAPDEALRAMWDQDGSNAETLGRERFTALSRRLGLQTMPAPLLDHMTPTWLALTASLADLSPPAASEAAATAPGSPPVLLDQGVIALARELGVEVQAIETFAQQLALIEGMGAELEESLADPAAAAETTEAMARLCYRGDVSIGPSFDDGAYHAMLRDRNLAWFPRLLPELEQGGVFVAVGAAHMLGREGLLALAEAEGFTVERLSGTVPDHPLPEAVHARAEAAEAPVLIDLAVRDTVARAMAENSCSMPASRCLEPDAARCTEQLARALGQCIDQAGVPDLPGLQALGEAGLMPIATCGVTTFSYQLMVEPSDDPACAAMAPGG